MKIIFVILMLFLTSMSSHAQSLQNPCNDAVFYHPNGGGVVALSAHVDPDVYIQKGSAVCEYAEVYDTAKILDGSIVRGHAQIHNDSAIKHSIIEGNSDVRRNTQVVDSKLRQTIVSSENCVIAKYEDRLKPYYCGPPAPCNGQHGEYRASGGFVSSTAEVDPTVYVERWSEVCDNAHVYDFVKILEGSVIRGNAHIDGNSIIKNSYIYGTTFLKSDTFVTNSILWQTEHRYPDSRWPCKIENYDDGLGAFECDPKPDY